MKNVYTERINNSIGYIKENLDRRLSLDEISSVSGFSRFHFQQIFRSFTGETVHSTVIRLRLERAAKTLIEKPSTTIKEVATAAGFSNTSAFSREFKRRFGMAPSAWKKQPDTDFPSSTFFKSLTEPENISPVSVETREIESFSIAYIKYTGAYSGDTALFIYLYNKLTTWAASKQLLTPDCENIVIYHHPADITEDARSKISLGVTIPDDTQAGGDFGKMKLGGGRYIICRYNLGDEEYGPAWNQVYRDILPAQKLQPADGWCFELYPNSAGNQDRHRTIVDLFIPVKTL